jgi:hypothetical protein
MRHVPRTAGRLAGPSALRSGFLSRAALAIAAASLTAACGGGGSQSDTPSTTTRIATRVVDGAIENATVCLDRNANGACDPGEPQARTDAGGNATLTVDRGDVGKGPVIAIVGIDAVDADAGPVTTPFVLQAPADRTALVSPLTTLVQQEVASSGSGTAQAAAVIRDALALAVDPLADYTAAATDATRTAGLVARLLVSTIQQHTVALAGAIGSEDASGTPITAADIERSVAAAVRQQLGAFASAATAAPLVFACTGALASGACATAVASQAQALVSESGITTVNVGALVAATRSVDLLPTAPEPSAMLRYLRYGDSDDWLYRVNVATAAENTLDASNRFQYRTYHRRSVAGALETWNLNGDPAHGGDLHWTGSAWSGCTPDTVNYLTEPDAAGRVDYDYCDGFDVGYAVRSPPISLASRPFADVLPLMRTSNGQESNGPFTLWGRPPSWFAPGADPDPIVAALGTDTFPAGSSLFYQTVTTLGGGPTYDPRDVNRVGVFAADVAAGGDARSGGTPPCSLTSNVRTPVTTLEELIAGAPGTPCLLAPATITGVDANGAPTEYSSGSPNEAWGMTTADLGVLGFYPVGTPARAYYTQNIPLRVAFTGPGTAVTYYACQQRWTDGSTRNCRVIGTGTYAIETLGDGRTMTFTNLPTHTAGLRFARVFVERGGFVYFGFLTRPYSRVHVRLTLIAANALLTKLGMPVISVALTPHAGVAAMQNATLEKFASCFQFGANWRAMWRAALDTELNAITQAISDGRMAFISAEADACVAWVNSVSCAEIFWASDGSLEWRARSPSCDAALVGQVANGDPCADNDECGSGFCYFSQACPGTCRAFTPLGEVCELNDECGPGKACDRLSSAPPVCAIQTAPGGLGEPCANRWPDCQIGLACIGVPNPGPTCAPMPGPGEECTEEGGRTFACVQGYGCGGTPLRCRPFVSTGESCAQAACGWGLYCSVAAGTTCQDYPSSGENCTDYPDIYCWDGTVCYGTPTKTCIAGTLAEGSPCDPYAPFSGASPAVICAPNTLCFPGTNTCERAEAIDRDSCY